MMNRLNTRLPRTIFELKEHSRRVIAFAASASIVLTPAMSFSIPQGGMVVAGQATIADGVGRVDVHQTNANSLTVNRMNITSSS
jgi:hypothetical protein